MSTYLGDWETDQFIAKMKSEAKQKKGSFLDCDGDSMIGDLDINDTITFTTPEPADNEFRFMLNEPTELFRIEQNDDVGGDVRLEAGKGTKEDGDIYFKASGKTLSLTSLLEIIQAMGYDHLIEKDNDQGVQCDFDGAKSIL